MIILVSTINDFQQVEVYQNCNIFNDGAFANLTDRDTKAEQLLYLENGEPMIFGSEKNKGIYLEDELKNSAKTNFCIGVAGYAEKHFESPNIPTDSISKINMS